MQHEYDDTPEESRVTSRPSIRRIAGRYVLGEVLGHGGYATVHVARDMRTDRAVAVKLFGPEPCAESGGYSRAVFMREATRTAAVAHPCVVRVFDGGFDGDEPFLVMELLEGETVAARLAARGAMASARALRIADQMLRGLSHIHAQDLVHADLKPSNVFLSDDRQVKLIDFGISRHCEEPADTEAIRGTPSYVAPEVVLGEAASARSDVYGAGMVLYTMLAGRSAYPLQANSVQTFYRVLEGSAPSLAVHRPSLPERLIEAIARATHVDPAERFSSALEMRSALRPLAREARSRPSSTFASPPSAPSSGSLEAPRLDDDE